MKSLAPGIHASRQAGDTSKKAQKRRLYIECDHHEMHATAPRGEDAKPLYMSLAFSVQAITLLGQSGRKPTQSLFYAYASDHDNVVFRPSAPTRL